MRGGTWLDLETFCELGAETLSDLGGNIGVEELTDGRLRAAGSMSGILDWLRATGEEVSAQRI